jgi:hypothetical protein
MGIWGGLAISHGKEKASYEWRPNHLFAYLLIHVRTKAMYCMQRAIVWEKRGYELLCSLQNLLPYLESPPSASDSRIAFAFPKQSLRNWDSHRVSVLDQFSGLRSALANIEVDLFHFALEAFSEQISVEPANLEGKHFQPNFVGLRGRSIEDDQEFGDSKGRFLPSKNFYCYYTYWKDSPI